jgi:hypothetical protein
VCGRSRHSGSRTVTAEAQRIDVGYSSSTISRTLLCPPAAVGPALPTSPFPLIGSALCPSAPLSLAVFSFRSSRALSPSLSLRPSLSLPIPASPLPGRGWWRAGSLGLQVPLPHGRTSAAQAPSVHSGSAAAVRRAPPLPILFPGRGCRPDASCSSSREPTGRLATLAPRVQLASLRPSAIRYEQTRAPVPERPSC